MLLANGAGFCTVSVAGPLVADPVEFDTVTVNTAPESPVVAGGVV